MSERQIRQECRKQLAAYFHSMGLEMEAEYDNDEIAIELCRGNPPFDDDDQSDNGDKINKYNELHVDGIISRSEKPISEGDSNDDSFKGNRCRALKLVQISISSETTATKKEGVKPLLREGNAELDSPNYDDDDQGCHNWKHENVDECALISTGDDVPLVPPVH